jgi:hypothetical protein
MQTLSLPAIALLFSLLGGDSQAAPAASLDWLAGQWCGGEGGERVEEHWTSPAKNGELLGLSRTLKDGRMASFEFLRIGDVDGVPTYLAQPGGRPPTAFKRSDGGERWVRFENPAHDFPTRIEYRREGEALQAVVGGKGRDGKDTSFTLDFVRCGN